MNAPTMITAWFSLSAGWLTEQSGRLLSAPALVSMGRNRHLRATVILRCAQAKADADKSMRSWKLPDTRLINAVEAR